MTLFARWIDMFWRPFLTVLHLSQTIISYIIVPFEITNVLNGYYRCLIYFTKSVHRVMQTSFTLYSVIGYTEIKINENKQFFPFFNILIADVIGNIDKRLQ